MPDKTPLSPLESCHFKLEKLKKLTLEINKNSSTYELLKMFEDLLKNDLNIGKMAMFTKNIKWTCIFTSGNVNYEIENINIEQDLVKYRDIVLATDFPNVVINEFDIIIPVLHKRDAIAYLLVGDIDNNKKEDSPSIKHMQFLQTFANIIVVAIENKRLFKQKRSEDRMRKEMEVASQVQNMLVPELSKINGFKQITAEGFYLPHYAVGGDYYDMFKISNEEIAFCIADVSGKGISAALLMSNFQANLNAIFANYSNLTDIVTTLNEQVVKNSKGDRFITLFLAKYNVVQKKITYINAGHNSPMLYDKSTKKIELLDKGCIGLGMEDAIVTIEEGETEIENNSKLLCYTDGLIEINEDDVVGSAIEVVKECLTNDKSIKDTFADMIKKLDINKSNNTIFDDITMLGLDINVNY